MERELSHEYPDESLTFEFQQEDRSFARVDFGAYGDMGDFAIHHIGMKQPRDYYFAYWTGTPDIAAYFLQNMANKPDAEEQLGLIKQAIQRRSQALYPTSRGEGVFRPATLASITEAIASQRPSETTKLTVDSITSSLLIFEPAPEGTWCIMDREWDEDERLTYGFFVPHDQSWQFVAGIVLKSYSEYDGMASERSRYPTTEFQKLLDAFECGLAQR